MTRLRKSDPDAFLSPAKSAEAFAADVAELRRVLAYDEETGLFTWKVQLAYRGKVGSVAGTVGAYGYWVIGIYRLKFSAHRLAWIYVHADIPEADIDHLNGIRSDNRIANLRAVTRSINAQNTRKAWGHSSTGFLGVSHQTRDRVFVAKIQVHGQLHQLGNFHSPEVAHAAYLKAKRRLHEGCTI